MITALTFQCLLNYHPIAESLVEAVSSPSSTAVDLRQGASGVTRRVRESSVWSLARTCKGSYDLVAPQIYRTLHLGRNLDRDSATAKALLPPARRAVRTLVVDVSSTCTWLGPFVASLSRLESLRLSFGPFADLSGLRWTDIPATVQNISLICPTPQLIEQLLTTSSASADPLSATTTRSIAADDDPASSSQPARSLPAAYESGLQRSARVFIWTWAVDDTSLVSWVDIASRLRGEICIYAKHLPCVSCRPEDLDRLQDPSGRNRRPVASRIIVVWRAGRTLNVSHFDLDAASESYTSQWDKYTLEDGGLDWDGLDSAAGAWAKLAELEREDWGR